MAARSNKHVNASLGPAFRASANKDKLLAVFDTGTALGYLPQTYFDAIYKDIKGFKALDKKLGVYSLPCDSKANVSMIFKCAFSLSHLGTIVLTLYLICSGTEYPVNPLDLTRLAQVDNKTVCINTFAPLNTTSAGFDVDLGDAFLRNVYMLMNYGNWTNASNHSPYVQLLSVRHCSL